MDDNSNRETVKIIEQYLEDMRVHYFNSNIQNEERYKKTRYATLINEAIPKTKGKYLTYLTDDNEFLSDRFSKMVELLEKDSSIEVIYSKQLVRLLNQKGDVEREWVRKAQTILKDPIGKVDHCSIMHTRKLADRIKQDFGSYWDDDPMYWYNGDAAFWRRLSKYKPFHPIPEILDIALKDFNSFQRLYLHLPRELPSGTLMKSPSTGIFILDGQFRRHVSSDAFELLKYDKSRIVEMPDPFLFRYPEGIPLDDKVLNEVTHLPNQLLIKASDTQVVYFLQKGYKHPIKSKKAFDNFHFRKESVIQIDGRKINMIPEGLPIVELSKKARIIPDGRLFYENSRYYLFQNNNYHPIEKEIAVKLKLPVSHPIKTYRNFLSNFNEGEEIRWEIPFV